MSAVLVLDANQRASLAVTRSLGRQGIAVYTADVSADSLAGSSKFSTAYLRHAPYTSSVSCIEDLIKFANIHGIDTLFPISDLSNQFCLQNPELKEHFNIPLNSAESTSRLADKVKLEQLAQELEILTPRTWHLVAGDALESLDSKLSFPLVIKPAKSRIIVDGKIYALPVTYASSMDALEELFDSNIEFRQVDMVFQEYIEGKGHGVFLLTKAGVPVARFAHQRLRERPPSGGVSVLSESVEISQESLVSAEKLLQAVDWTGVAMVEFKLTKDGTPYLIEVNTRFWGSLQLAIDSGVDFPFLLYQMMHKKNNIQGVTQYNIGNKLRWLMGDIDYLYLLLSGKSPCLTGTSRLQALINFFNFFDSNVAFEVNRLEDMQPFWFELKNYFRQ